jgi:ABC-2 type transport system permease protein
VLGEPDNGVILAGYVGSLLMAGGFLAIGAAISAITKSQVIAFVITAAICFVFTVSGSTLVLNFFSGWAPPVLVETVASFSFLTHFTSISRGVIDLRDIIFFGSLIAAFLFANAVIVDMRKSG